LQNNLFALFFALALKKRASIFPGSGADFNPFEMDKIPEKK